MSWLTMNPDAEVHVHTCPFGSVDINSHIDRCDIWYQGGGCPAKVKNLFELYPQALQYLTHRVLSGSLLYIGGCAGMIMTGSRYEDARGQTPTFCAMGLIPGMISIAETVETQDRRLSTMGSNDIEIPCTKQTALLICGWEAKACAIKNADKCKVALQKSPGSCDCQYQTTCHSRSWNTRTT